MQLNVTPPPMRVAGMTVAFEVPWSVRNCSKTEEKEIDPQTPGVGVLRLVASRLRRHTTLNDADRKTVLDLTEAILSGRLELLVRFAQRFIEAPHKLVFYRDLLRELLSGLENQSLEIMPTRPFRISVGGALCDAVTIALKDRESSMVIVVASHPALYPAVYRLMDLPDGSCILEAEPHIDPRQLFASIIESAMAR